MNFRVFLIGEKYRVNDGTLEIADDIVNNNEKLIRYLKKIGTIRKYTRINKIDIYGESDYILNFSYCGKPTFELINTKTLVGG